MLCVRVAGFGLVSNEVHATISVENGGDIISCVACPTKRNTSFIFEGCPPGGEVVVAVTASEDRLVLGRAAYPSSPGVWERVLPLPGDTAPGGEVELELLLVPEEALVLPAISATRHREVHIAEDVMKLVAATSCWAAPVELTEQSLSEVFALVPAGTIDEESWSPASDDVAPARSTCAAKECGLSKCFAPDAFRVLRERDGMDASDVLRSVATLGRGQEGEGKSGAHFWMAGGGLLGKSMSSTETAFLLTVLPPYIKHHQEYPASLISRFYGAFEVQGRSVTSLVLMNDVFAGAPSSSILEKFDIKGSTAGRTAAPVGGVFSKLWSPSRGKAKESSVKKDGDVEVSFGLGTHRDALWLQLDADTAFLDSINAMDYSLLIGVDRTFEHDPDANKWSGVAGEDGCYYLGVIDILQEYTALKALESKIKTGLFLQQDPSAVDSTTYRERFLRFLTTVIQNESSPLERSVD